MKFRNNKLRVLIPIFIFLFGVITCFSINFTEENSISHSNQDSNEINEIPYPAAISIWDRIWELKAGEYYDYGKNIAYDLAGNYYIVGSSQNETTLKNTAFLVKYGNNGDFLWSKNWTGEGEAECNDVAVDSLNNVYVTGVILNGGVQVLNTLKFNSIGDLKWNTTWDVDLSSVGQGIAVGADNYLYVTGYNSTAIGSDVVLLKYNMTTGAIEDLKTYTGIGSTINDGEDIVIDAFNNIYIVGTNESMVAGGDILLLKINSTMDLNWTIGWNNPYGTWNDDEGMGVGVDWNGYIYVVGYNNTLIFSELYRDGVLLKFDKHGNLEWQKILHNQYNYTRLNEICIFQDDIYISGIEAKAIDDEDAIILKYNNTGDLKLKEYWGGNEDDGAWGITVLNPFEIAIVGSTASYAIGLAPDAFISTNSSEIIPVTGPQENYTLDNDVIFNWHELRYDGNELSFTDKDDGELVINFNEWNITFYDTEYENITVSTNGWMSFPDKGDSSWFCEDIPSLSLENQDCVALFCVDVNMDPEDDGGGTVYYYFGGSKPNRYLIIEYFQVRDWDTGDLIGSFEVIFHESGNIKFQYKNVVDLGYDPIPNFPIIGLDHGDNLLYSSYEEILPLNSKAIKFIINDTAEDLVDFTANFPLPGGDDDDDDDDDDEDGIIPGYDIYLIIILITFISSIYLHKKLKK